MEVGNAEIKLRTTVGSIEQRLKEGEKLKIPRSVEGMLFNDKKTVARLLYKPCKGRRVSGNDEEFTWGTDRKLKYVTLACSRLRNYQRQAKNSLRDKPS